MKKSVSLFIQAVVSAVLIYFVFRNIDIPSLSQVLGNAAISHWLIALIFLIPAVLLGVLKWKLLAGAIMERALPFKFFLSYYLVGYFYTLFIPGGQIIGEGVKAMRISNKSEDKHQLFLSVFIDRVVGFVALGSLILISFIFQPVLQKDYISVFSLLVSLGITIVGLVILFAQSLLEYIFILLGYLARFLPESIQKHFNILKFHILEYRHSRKTVVRSIALGMLSQLSWVLVLYFLALSLNLHLSMFFVIWMFLVVTVATFIPISYAGLGVREGTFVYFLSLIGISSETALGVSLLLFGSQILIALVGLGIELKELFRRYLIA